MMSMMMMQVRDIVTLADIAEIAIKVWTPDCHPDTHPGSNLIDVRVKRFSNPNPSRWQVEYQDSCTLQFNTLIPKRAKKLLAKVKRFGQVERSATKHL